MRARYGTILVLIVAAVALLTVPQIRAVEQEEEDIWSEDEPRRGHREHRWFELTDEAIEEILDRIAEKNPEEAEELARLREEDPERFEMKIREIAREHFGKRFKEHMEHRAGGKHHPGPHMPGMGPAPKTGMPGMGPKGEMMRERMREKHEEYLEWLEENYPEEAEKLAGLREERPELYMRHLGLCLKKYGRICEAAKRNPELAEVLKEDLELKERRDELLREIRATTDDDEKEELVEELGQVVGSRFDLIVRRKQIEYEQLREKLEELKKEVEQREAEVAKWKEAKDQEVEERVKELVGRTEEFDWD
jgi:hypothetical protein